MLAIPFISILLLSGSYTWGFDKNIECPYPEGQDVSSESECTKYTSCVWMEDTCTMRGNSEAGYTVKGTEMTDRGVKLMLEKHNPEMTLFDKDIQRLTFESIFHEDYHLQIKIYATSLPRYEVPVPLNLPETPTENPLYHLTIPAEGLPFSFTVERSARMPGHELFDMIGALVFEDQFLQITTSLPSTYVYGMGENTHSNFKHRFDPRQTYPIFARDHGIEEGVLNVYGHHPYFVNVDNETGEAYSVLLFNSNAMEYSTFLLDDGRPAMTLRAIGGIIDLHFFLGPSLEDVNTQYTKMIGYPVFPPYWSLGFHLCRWGYNNTNHVRAVRQRIKAMGIPQDGQTLDIDYMDRNRDFTYGDGEGWSDLPDLVEELHNDGLKVTLILDPAVVVDWDNYPPGQRGKDKDVYIKWSSDLYIPDDQDSSWLDYMVGRVWPDMPTVFPDFLNPATQEWWTDEIKIFHEQIPFDSLWIDMNEPANFGTNLLTAKSGNVNKKELTCPYNTLDSPPYPTMTVRTGGSSSQRISEHTICMSGNQSDGVNSYLHYDVHSLYGWSESVATYNGLQEVIPGKRPLVLSRSTFVGSGHYAIHWLGDNSAIWSHLKMSVVGLLEFNLFGIPMVGADVCGFNLEPDMEMCARWTQLGAFYPFNRNHNSLNYGDQDPAMWPEVAEISRDILNLRYKYLPYLYSLLHNAHMYGHSVVRPVFSKYPTDTIALDVDDQFFWGEGIMVAPVLTPNTVERNVYFPLGEWYELQSGIKIVSGPKSLIVPAPLNTIPVYVLGGTILPYQIPALTTSESRNNPFGLTVALDSVLKAQGEIFWDDGESEHVMDDTYLATVTFADNLLKLEPSYSSEPVQGLNLETVEFLGYPSSPSAVEVNGIEVPSSDWSYDEANLILVVTLSSPLGESINIKMT